MGELRPGCSMNGAAHATPWREAGIGGVDDGVDVERGDIGELR
jgi:hypothetical protein